MGAVAHGEGAADPVESQEAKGEDGRAQDPTLQEHDPSDLTSIH